MYTIAGLLSQSTRQLKNEIDEYGLCSVGERIFDVQRAIIAREGHRWRQGVQRISGYTGYNLAELRSSIHTTLNCRFQVKAKR